MSPWFKVVAYLLGATAALALALAMLMWMTSEADGHAPCSPACVAHSKARARARIRAHKLAVIRPYTAWLESTGACESGTDGNLSHGLHAYNGSGPYLGRYQMGWNAWHKAGGRGNPLDAGWLEQAYRAVRWRQIIGQLGYGPHTTIGWPVCG